MSKSVVLTLESRFMDEYGEYANLPVFNAHGSIVGYVGGEVPESGNPCEFNRLDDEGFTFCASATEVVRLKAENAKLRERITTQKQTIQAYRDESREWREVAERAQAENAKLRELVDYMTPIALYAASEQERDRMRELAIGGEDGAQGPDDRA